MKIDGKMGFIDAAGKAVIPPTFAAAEPFHEGLAAVMAEDGGLWRFINKAGEFAFPGAWGEIRSFSEGRALIRPFKSGPYGFIDASGKELIPARYWQASTFSGGLARVEEKNDETGLWGYIDPMGKTVFENKRISAAFHYGRAWAQVMDPTQKHPMGNCGFVDVSGKMVVPATLEWAKEFSEGLAPFAVGCDHEAVKKMLESESASPRVF